MDNAKIMFKNRQIFRLFGHGQKSYFGHILDHFYGFFIDFSRFYSIFMGFWVNFSYFHKISWFFGLKFGQKMASQKGFPWESHFYALRAHLAWELYFGSIFMEFLIPKIAAKLFFIIRAHV